MDVQSLIDELENYRPDTEVFVLTNTRGDLMQVHGISADKVNNLSVGTQPNGVILWADYIESCITEHKPIDSLNKS
jgi:hypothetical protein